MKLLLENWRQYLNEADDSDWDALPKGMEGFGFSDEEKGEPEGKDPHLEDLLGLDRGDTFTIGNRKPVYRVIGAPTESGKAVGSPIKIAVIDGSGERKDYEISRTGTEYEVGAFKKDENFEYTELVGKTGFVMNITKAQKDNRREF